MAFRSFHDAKSMELRMRCTMQVCTIVCGKTALIASGKPFRPSTTAMRMSPTPRFFSSFMTRSQNLAPSEVSIHRPRKSFAPSGLTPSFEIKSGDDGANPHTGYAWAWTQGALDGIGGLFELGGMGSGDHHMALALVDLADRSLPEGCGDEY